MNNWKEFVVTPHYTILETMKIIGQQGKKFAIVCESNFQLVGVVTDGDIRRGLLAGAAVSDPISKVMNKNPIVVNIGASKREMLQKAESTSIDYLIVIDQNGYLENIISLPELKINDQKPNSVVIMAGGLGVRLGELTTDCPKPMLKVGNKPILERIMEQFKLQGFSNFILSVNYKAELIEEYFGNGEKFGVEIEYVKEPIRLGTAGSLSLIQQARYPLIVINGDVLIKIDFSLMFDFHQKKNFDITVCTRTYEVQIPYGVIKTKNELVTAIEEKPLKKHLINTGVYVLSPKALELIPHNTYFDMTQLIELSVKNKLRVGAFEIDDFWIDIGHKDDFYKANNSYGE